MFRKRLFLDILNVIENGMCWEDDIVERLVKDYSMFQLLKKHGIYRIIKNHIRNLEENGYIDNKNGMINLNLSSEEYIVGLKRHLALNELVLAY